MRRSWLLVGVLAAAPLLAEARHPLSAEVSACAACHREIVERYLRHGMSRSVGPTGVVAPGGVADPITGGGYEIVASDRGPELVRSGAMSPRRRQRIVGRIGAGVFDTSWVTMELDPFRAAPTGRLFFAPIETITDHGHELSPFALYPGHAGIDFALTRACLTCHTTSALTALSGAGADPGRLTVYPSNQLGENAFAELAPIGCADCHGPPDDHLRVMTGVLEAPAGEIGIARLGALDPGIQRDVCARCHLQGDARLELVAMPPKQARPLAAQVPVLVPSRQLDDFRFVGQLERLSLSDCFRGSPEMTCATCHEPHTAVREQGTASFDSACAACHETGSCSRPEDLSVTAASGRQARTEAGCVDCHVRRSQPIDLPHIDTADHWIRRRIPPPRAVPHRQFADPLGSLEVWDDGRLAPALATPEGRRWLAGLQAIALTAMGRIAEATRLFAEFPTPGTPEARRPTAPQPLAPLETATDFHQTRAQALGLSGAPTGALAALDDALAVDPGNALARMGRARLRFASGDAAGALADTEILVAAHPLAEAPWNLRAEIALANDRPDLAAQALERSTGIWPSDPETWRRLARALRLLNREAQAGEAMARAERLDPPASPPTR